MMLIINYRLMMMLIIMKAITAIHNDDNDDADAHQPSEKIFFTRYAGCLRSLDLSDLKYVPGTWTTHMVLSWGERCATIVR